MDSKVLCKGTPARSLSGNIIPRLNQPTFPRRHSASGQALLLGSTAAWMLWVPCPVPGLAHRPHVTRKLALPSLCSPFASTALSPLLPGALYPLCPDFILPSDPPTARASRSLRSQPRTHQRSFLTCPLAPVLSELTCAHQGTVSFVRTGVFPIATAQTGCSGCLWNRGVTCTHVSGSVLTLHTYLMKSRAGLLSSR